MKYKTFEAKDMVVKMAETELQSFQVGGLVEKCLICRKSRKPGENIFCARGKYGRRGS